MIILAIETSCDDTSVALISAEDGAFNILAQKTASQIEIHKKYGGVVPEVAGRKHANTIFPVITEALEGQPEPDIIAATTGPGLITGLIVGAEAGKALSYLWKKPFVSVNHIEGHIHSVLLEQNNTIQFPALCLTVSGGHTELVLMKDHGDYELLGKTVDDAAGEAFDKAAKMLELEYPGGPKISKLAETGNPNAIPFPRPMLNKQNLNFSFAGLKTAALYWLRKHPLTPQKKTFLQKLKSWTCPAPQTQKETINDFCASFEQAIVDVLMKKTQKAAKKHKPNTIILTGGVSANEKLRNTLSETFDIPVLTPLKKYCMDNGTMIAAAAYFKAQKNQFTDWTEIRTNPNWKVYTKNS